MCTQGEESARIIADLILIQALDRAGMKSSESLEGETNHFIITELDVGKSQHDAAATPPFVVILTGRSDYVLGQVDNAMPDGTALRGNTLWSRLNGRAMTIEAKSYDLYNPNSVAQSVAEAINAHQTLE